MAEKDVNASFENVNMQLQFALTIDDKKTTQTVSAQISPTATANTLNSVAEKFAALLAVAPSATYRTSKDLIEE